MGKMTSNGDLAATETGARLAPWMNALVRYVQSNQPDLTNRQLALLLIVYLLPGPHTVRGLAARLHVSKPVITREFGRASGRERVCQYVYITEGGGSVKNKKDPYTIEIIYTIC